MNRLLITVTLCCSYFMCIAQVAESQTDFVSDVNTSYIDNEGSLDTAKTATVYLDNQNTKYQDSDASTITASTSVLYYENTKHLTPSNAGATADGYENTKYQNSENPVGSAKPTAVNTETEKATYAPHKD